MSEQTEEMQVFVEFEAPGNQTDTWSTSEIMNSVIEALEHQKMHDCDCAGHEGRYYTLLAVKAWKEQHQARRKTALKALKPAYSIRDIHKSHGCCMGTRRDYKDETKGWTLPPSEHAPSCINYVAKQYPRLTTKGGSFIMRSLEALTFLSQGGEAESVELVKLTDDQFYNLKDFEG